MRRTIAAVGLLLLTMSVSGCSCFFGVVGQDIYHDHQDGGVIGGTAPIKSSALNSNTKLKPYWVGEFRLEKVWDSDYAAHVLGGVRFQNDTRFKWPIFYEFTGGLTHYPGNNLLTLHPNLGFMIPRAGHEPRFFVRLGLPIYFYSILPKVGTEFTVGYMFGKK